MPSEYFGLRLINGKLTPDAGSANDQHLAELATGRAHWNRWRKRHPSIAPSLRGAMLNERDFSGFDLRDADLAWARLNFATLKATPLDRACLTHAQLVGANLEGASLVKTDLEAARLYRARLARCAAKEAVFSWADLYEACFARADCEGAHFEGAAFVKTDLRGANLDGAYVFGASVWGVKVNAGTRARNLEISENKSLEIKVDDLEVAQFVYLLLNNSKLANVIDTLTSRVVLVLGRFSGNGKQTLELLRELLRAGGYLPIVFDFKGPASRDLPETISVLARLARFVVADLTGARSVAQELGSFVRDVRVPIVPIIHRSEAPYSLFEDLKKYSWVLPAARYESGQDLSKKFSRIVTKRGEQAFRLVTPAGARRSPF